jgi:hypothetical protein
LRRDGLWVAQAGAFGVCLHFQRRESVMDLPTGRL